MPMPPAKRSERRACTSSGNLLRGSLISSVSPTCTRSCRAFDPPRELGSFRTPIVYLLCIPAGLQSEYWRTSPPGRCTSTCAPALYGGSAPPSARCSSKLRTSSASARRPTTRTSSTSHPRVEDDGLAAEPRLDHPFGEPAVHRIGVLRKPARKLEGEGAGHAELARRNERLHLVHRAQHSIVLLEMAGRRREPRACHPLTLLVEVLAQMLRQRAERLRDARVVSLHQPVDSLGELAMSGVHCAEAESHGLHQRPLNTTGSGSTPRFSASTLVVRPRRASSEPCSGMVMSSSTESAPGTPPAAHAFRSARIAA